MLNIPVEIKEKLKTNTATKNFRVTFPNGERADIINDNIVFESVRFTESICSQDKLKFGLCETPVIEFEVFDIENIKNKRIECYYEIYCEDTVEDAVYRDDLDAYVYPIPLGAFYVDSCKREAKMNIRRVIAYLDDMFNSSDGLGLYLADRWNEVKEEYTINIYKNFISSNSDSFGLNDFTHESQTISTIEYAYFEGANWTGSGQFPNIRWYDSDNRLHSITVEGISTSSFTSKTELNILGFTFNAQLETDQLFYVPVNPNVESSQKTNILAVYDDIVNGGYDITDDAKEKLLARLTLLYKPLYQYLQRNLNPIFLSSGAPAFQYYYDIETSRFLYLPRTYAVSSNQDHYYDMIFLGFKDIRIKHKVGSTTVSNYDFQNIFSASDFGLYKITENFINVTKTFPMEQVTAIYGIQTNCYSAINGYSQYNSREDMEAVLELMGYFGKVGRDGKFSLISLTDKFENISDVIGVSSYSTLWYDDDMTKPYGRITCSYKQADGVNYYSYYDIVENFNTTDFKIYDISNNALINNNVYTEEEITAIFEEMAEHMVNVSYMPFELDLIGRPDLESGDVIAISVNNGITITSLIMQRSLNGIMTLEDDMNATENENELKQPLQLNSAFDPQSGTLSLLLAGGK